VSAQPVHPLLRPRGFALRVPPLLEVLEQFESLLGAGEASLCCWGQPRVGKTTARSCLRSIHEGRWPIASVSVERQARPNSINKWEFWSWFLVAMGSDAASFNPGSARERLIKELRVRADKFETSNVLLLVDEAQNLVPQHLAMLKQLTDSLIEWRLIPFVVLFGHMDVRSQLQMLGKANMGDVVDRFFTNWHHLRGLHLDEFEQALSLYDEPFAGRATSFAADFAPSLVRKGWTLASEASRFVASFDDVAKSIAAPRGDEVEMKYFTAAVRQYLVQLHRLGDDARSSAELIRRCVEESGLIQARKTAQVLATSTARASRARA
jgi:hypothetical protein